MAATQDNLSQTPLIVPNSPTGLENEQGVRPSVLDRGFIYKMQESLISNRFLHTFYLDLNEDAEPAKETSGTLNDQAQKGQEEPMEVDPVPQSTVSNVVSQNSPSSASEKSLSLPTQPEFSHVCISDHLNA